MPKSSMLAKFLKTSEPLLLKQSVLTLFLRVLGAISLFGFTVFLTKSYSPQMVGQYDFVRAFLLVGGSICLLGFEGSILYFKGRIKPYHRLEAIKKIYLKMLWILLYMSMLLVLLFLCLDRDFVNAYFGDVAVYDLLLQAVLCLFFYGLSTLNTEVFRALDRIGTAELFRNIIKFVPLILGSVLLWYFGLEAYLVQLFLLSFVLLALVSTGIILYLFNKGEEVKEAVDFSYKEIVLKSYPLALSGLAMFLMMSFDILFLKKYWGNREVAYYGVAVKLMTLITLVILSVNISVSSKISEYFFSGGRAELLKTVRHASRLIFMMSLPLSLILCSAPVLILSVFGREYIAAKEALLILLLGQGICAAFGTAGVYLIMSGRQQVFLLIMMAAVAMNAVLNRLLIPQYGMNGAAIAFVSASFFWNSCSAAVIYRLDRVKVFLH